MSTTIIDLTLSLQRLRKDRMGPLNKNTDNNQLSLPLLLLIGLGAALSVSTLYFSQPLLGMIKEDLGTTVGLTTFIAAATQMGYAGGLFFLAPLGDRYDKKRVISLKLAGLILSLILCFLSNNIYFLIAASFGVGIFATAAQDFVPAVAALSPESRRGQNIGYVVTAILLGILLSRVGSGTISQTYGWRSVFAVGSVLITFLLLLTLKKLPSFAPSTKLSYKQLLHSLFALAKQYPELRDACLTQALLYSAFSAFWSTLALILHDQFHLGPLAAGLFGFAGAAGTLAAPIAGKLSDRVPPRGIARVGAIITTISFALLFFVGFIPSDYEVLLLVVSAIGFDFGIQGSLVAHQTIIYGLNPDARSRINAIFVTGNFIGMGIGSIIGGMIYGKFNFLGFSVYVTVVSALAVLTKMKKG